MIENVFRVVEFQLARKQLHFKIQVVGAPPSQGNFLADWEIFELVCFHLITNAVKYSNTGGDVIVKLSLSNDPLQLNFMVRDRGVGMSEEKLARVRQELEHSLHAKQIVTWEMGHTDSGAEIGFGLSTSNMLINLLNGRLELTSLPWYKTEAKFSFPVK